MTPEIENQLDYDIDEDEDIVDVIEIPSKTYKLNKNRIIGFIDNIEAVKQAIYHILNTERGEYLIYDEDYGIELKQYIGKDFEFLESTIENTLYEALTMDLRITDVNIDEIIPMSETQDKVYVRFTVETIYGDLQMEVDINV